MSLLPFAKLDAYKERRFVPAGADLGDWLAIGPLFDRLEDRAAAADSVPALEQWLLDCGELSAALDQESSCRYIAMTCHTDNSAAEAAYLQFVEEIEPKLKPRQFALAKLFLAHPLRARLPKDRYFVLDRDLALQVELFREENVPLETEESKLGQQYQKISGGLTVTFRGEEKTLVQMGRLQEEPDRPTRQEAWELVSRRRLAEKEKFEDIFDSLIRVREQIAANAGFGNYRDYAFRARGRFDYTPADCESFHAAIESEIVPLLRDQQARRREQLGVDRLRPWDLAVDPLNRPALRPFETVDELLDGGQKIFNKVNEALGAEFKLMRDRRVLDLANRKGKAPGGYQSTLSEARLPFIFMNAVGMQRDVETLLHEAGHAFHALATRDEDLFAYRHAPIEFCEVASMAMELLGGEFIEAYYDEAGARRARTKHLQGIIEVFPWIATIDAFQHWLYTHRGHTRDERAAAWLELVNRFGGDVDWTGLEEARRHAWHRQLHLFLHAFYYVEYGIAQLGALQVWANSKSDRKRAVEQYRAGLSLGGSRPLPELFERAGCRFDFSADTVRPLAAMLKEELARLED
ncbi:MAG TPA: M3 family oligoendopeptidase [Verrucomicrobiales bacterium]|nr:M3 family oligoendopeptidase [Verrucomicrobiales bacterium]